MNLGWPMRLGARARPHGSYDLGRHGAGCALLQPKAELIPGFNRDQLGGKAGQRVQATTLPQDARVRQEPNPVLP